MEQVLNIVDELTELTEKQADLIYRLFDLLSQHLPAEDAEEISNYYGLRRRDVD